MNAGSRLPKKLSMPSIIRMGQELYAANPLLHVDRPAREPGEEAVERGPFLRFELERAGDQLLDRIARRFSSASRVF